VHKQKILPFEFDGYLGSGRKMKFAISKYGKNNFFRETLFVFDNHIDAFLKEAEIVNNEFIKNKNVYNTCIGGQTPVLCGEQNGFYGKKHSKETLEKIRKSLEIFYGGKQFHNEESKRKISEFMKSFWTDETKRRMSIQRKEYWKNNPYPESAKKKLSEKLKGRVFSEDHKRKISESKRLQWESDEFREKQMKHLSSPERCKKISKALKGKKKTIDHINKINKNPEKIRKTAEKHRGMKRSEEAKKKMSDAKKGKVPPNKIEIPPLGDIQFLIQRYNRKITAQMFSVSTVTLKKWIDYYGV
jgi:hypothetical protein